jgi:rRNA maturation endonuclease Nob1
MAACLQCGKIYESDYLLWKGGKSQAFCEQCQAEELKKETKSKDKSKITPDRF